MSEDLPDAATGRSEPGAIVSLSLGTRLGPYEILAFIGKGGMGEVYRARDTRLDRTVAIKVLPEHRLSDQEMRQRFVREARAIGNLSHPHICHLNDLGSHEGIDFLVMEHLEGETLADRLIRVRGSASGPTLRIEEVLRYATEMADALSEAHRHGIVHRDLKPSNVMITPSGVKVLDFGVAKFGPPPVGGVGAMSTLGVNQPPLTAEGVVLGTWPYMSPEQLEGKEADGRTDIFAFGTVVFEMATGRRAFEGDSHASVIAAILERDPPHMSTLQPLVPAALDRVVRKCLAKNPDARWQTTRDLADELRWVAEDHRQPRPVGPAVSPSHAGRSPAWPWVAALALAIATGGAIAWSLTRREAASQPIRRFAIQPSPPIASLGDFALSPDGQHLVYRARLNQSSQLYVRPLDQFEPRALPGTEGGSSPTISPDGQWVAFSADGKLKKVSLTSAAAPSMLSDLSGCCAGSTSYWFPDDSIVVPLIATGLVKISAQGGTPVPLTQPDTKNREIDHHSPIWLPGERAMLIGVHRGADAFDVAVQPLDGSGRRILVKDAFEARYAPTGHLLFVRDDVLFAAPFDANRLELTGPAVAMLENVATFPESGAASYRVSDDGSLAYVRAPSLQGRRIVWVDRHGTVERLPVGPRGFGAPSLSPDGRRIALQIDEASRRDIWIYEFDTDALTRVTFDGVSTAPIWTPDGQRIVFSSTKDGRRQIYWQPADGSGHAELLVGDEHSVWAGSWSADRQTLAYTRQPPTDLNDVALLRLGEGTSGTLFLSSQAQEQWPRVSPDGRWLAYMSTETGRDEIYVTPLSGSGSKRQISVDGGRQAVWSRAGKELFYRNRGQFMVVSVGSLPASFGKPVALPIPVRSATGRHEYFGHPGYDVSADGRLLIVEQAQEEAAPAEIQIVLNWFEELKRRVPNASPR